MRDRLPPLTHALLIVQRAGSHLQPVLDAYCRRVVCASSVGNEPCGRCAPCARVAAGNYYDLVDIGAREPLSKERVIALQDRFAHGALEQAGKKICVLRQIERASAQAVNALLLFLEQPPSDTYAILTTRNENAVPATVVSRCMRLLLRPGGFDWKAYAKEQGLSEADADALTALYWCVDDATAAVADGSFPKVAQVARGFLRPRMPLAAVKDLYERFRALPPADLSAVISYLTACAPPARRGPLLELGDALRLNPIKSALFWRLLRACEGK